MDVTSKPKTKAEKAAAQTSAGYSGSGDPLRQGGLQDDSLPAPLLGGRPRGAGRAAPATHRLVAGKSLAIGADRRASVLSMSGEVELIEGSCIKFNNDGKLIVRVITDQQSYELVVSGAAGDRVDLETRADEAEIDMIPKDTEAPAEEVTKEVPAQEGAL